MLPVALEHSALPFWATPTLRGRVGALGCARRLEIDEALRRVTSETPASPNSS